MAQRRERQPDERRQQVVEILHALGRVKEAIRAFEDGEVNLLVAWHRILLETERRAAA